MTLPDVSASALIASTGGLAPSPSWNLLADVRALLEFPFMVNAFRAGTIVAVLAGLIGWFMVARRQSFTGHTLAVVGFPGAAGALLVGVSVAYGYFTFAIVAALLIAVAPGAGGGLHGAGGHGQESAATGTVQAAALAAGWLFTSLYGGFTGGGSALLFGSFLGITAGQVLLLLAVAVAAVAGLAVIGRPLLFATVDPSVAAARGVPVRALATGFLVMLAVAAAEAAQITGSLLVFALLVVPAATAQAITARPGLSITLTLVLAVAITWLALAIAYYQPYPIGFYLTSLAFAGYLTATGWRLARTRRQQRQPADARPQLQPAGIR